MEPATLVKVKAPLNGRVCGRACLGSYDPALVPENPIGLIKKDSTRLRDPTSGTATKPGRVVDRTLPVTGERVSRPKWCYMYLCITIPS